MGISTDDYRRLCEFSDRVLQDCVLDDALVANPSLHIIRAHPVFLRQYESVLAESSGRAVSRLKAFIGYIRFSLDKLGLIPRLTRDNSGYSVAGHSADNPDVLFVSHYINAAHHGLPKDFYFGNLPIKLRFAGYRVGIVYINHTTHDIADLAKHWPEDGISRYFLARSCSVEDTHDCLLQAAAMAEKLKGMAVSNQEDAKYSGFCRLASVTAKSRVTLGNLSMARNFGNLLKVVSPHLVVFTHEGQAWEKLFCAELKRNSPATIRMGYIQAALFATQHSLLKKLPDLYSPDRVATTGEIALNQLREAEYYRIETITVLGSHKIDQFSGDAQQKERICLVLPEGLIEECVLLFRFSLEAARQNPDIVFIWRLHPLLTFEEIASKNQEFRHLPDNIIQSNDSYEADLARSKWAIYRGSTAIIPALAARVKPLYLHQKGEINMDPLHRVDSWRKSVSSVSDLP
jgi:hypothetical protein